MITKEIDGLIARALKEDMPRGDITSESLFPQSLLARAVLTAKSHGVLAGLDIFSRVFRLLDPGTSVNRLLRDGQVFEPGDILAEIEGKAVVLLEGERTALNFLQRLSGIATTTRRFVDAVAGTKAAILDTRKTTPGLRALEKYAVRMGGGQNHRPDLSSMVLIKDNHLAVARDLAAAVRRVRKKIKKGVLVEVEVTNLNQAKTALAAGADWIMLDNMAQADMKRAVASVKGRAKVEASGRVSLDNVRAIARTGVDYISVGKLTHSFTSADLSLEFIGRLGCSVNRLSIPARLRGMERS
jgi:nicotinate-nucleotide pyrophosphorylase (carboxylating)